MNSIKWNHNFKIANITKAIIDFKIKIGSCTAFEPQTSCLLLYHLSYPGSINDTGLNLPLESNPMLCVDVYDAICHHLYDELTSPLFIYSDVLNQIDK